MSKSVSHRKQGSSLLSLQSIIASVSIATIATAAAVHFFLILKFLRIIRNQEAQGFLQDNVETDVLSTIQEEAVSPPPTTSIQSPKRSWLEIINSASTVILVLVTTVYVILTFMLVNSTHSQLELTQEPTLSIEPEKMVSGEIADFILEIKNRGVAGVTDIEIYQDYFVALKPPDEPLALYRFGMVNMLPDVTIPYLGSGEATEFIVEFGKEYPQMTEFYTSGEKGARTMVLRILVRFRRELDGKQFELSKVYIIAGDGSTLIDDTARQLEFDFPETVSLEEIKSVLGVK